MGYFKATISGVTTTATSARITITTPTNTDYTDFRLFVRTGGKNGTGTAVFDRTYTTWSASRVVSVTGLSPSTTYTCNVCSIDGGVSEWANAVEFTTAAEQPPSPPSTRPSYWSWTSGLTPSRVESALSGGDEISRTAIPYLTAQGWTDYTQNIKDVYRYKKNAPYTGPLENGGSGTTELSHEMVQHAVDAISAMSPSSPVPTAEMMKQGAYISADLLNRLANSLNSVS